MMPEENLDALSRPASTLCRVDAGVQPEGTARVPEVGPLGRPHGQRGHHLRRPAADSLPAVELPNGSNVLSVVVAGAESAVPRLRMGPLLSAFASRRPHPEAPGLPARGLRPGDRPRHHGRPARPEVAPAVYSRPEPAHSSPR